VAPPHDRSACPTRCAPCRCGCIPPACTGDLLGSLPRRLRRAVWRTALVRLAVTDGVLLYLAQEGRGIFGPGPNKLRAYRLQDAGLDHLPGTFARCGFGRRPARLRAAARHARRRSASRCV
jgi:hypothetical protein